MSFILKSLQKKKGIWRYIGPKRTFLIIGLSFFFFVSWYYYQSGAVNLEIFLQYRDNHPIGVILLFVLVYIISVIAVLPSLPLNLVAGFFWGGILGGFYTAVSVTLGGWLSFMLARTLIGRLFVRNYQNRWANIIQDEFNKSPRKFVAFLRLNPVIPTGPLNYLLGLTSLSSKDFIWVTFVFLLPPSIAVAYIGDIMQTFITQEASVSRIVRGMLIISATVTFLVGIRFIAKILTKLKR